MLEDAVKSGAATYEEVKRMLGFGKGCGRCENFIKSFVDELLEECKG